MPLDHRFAGLKWRDFCCIATDRHVGLTFCVYHRIYTRDEVIQTCLISLFNQINSSLTMNVTSDRYIRFPVFPTPWGIPISDDSLSYYDLTVAGRTDKARPPMADHQQWMAAHYHARTPTTRPRLPLRQLVGPQPEDGPLVSYHKPDSDLDARVLWGHVLAPASRRRPV